MIVREGIKNKNFTTDFTDHHGEKFTEKESVSIRVIRGEFYKAPS